MAAVGLKTLIEDMSKCFECPVCMDTFKDPRSLACQHQFCCGCLQTLISVTHGDNKPADWIRCPTCREITHLKSKQTLKELPRPTLLNKLQELVETVTGAVDERRENVMCDVCRDFETCASSYCLQCNKHLCEPCLRRHEEFRPLRSHVTIPLLEELMCEAHGEVFIVHCETCKKNLCSLCILKGHTIKHKVVAYHSELMYKFGYKLQKHKLHFHNLSKSLKGKVKEIDDTFEKAEHEICDWYSKSKALLREKADSLLKNLLKSKVKLGDKFHKEVRNTELETMHLKTPLHLDVLGKHIASMESVIEELHLRYQEEEISKYGDEAYYPIEWSDESDMTEERCAENLEKLFSLKLNKSVTNIQFDEESQRILVKTKGLDAPVKVFNYQGEQTGHWGQSIKGVYGEGAICLDSKRHLFLLACTDSIAIVNKLGYVQDKIRIPIMNKRHCGLAYSARDDLYAVTDIGNHCLQVVDPRTKGVVRRCGTKGEGKFHFDGPYYVQFNEKTPRTTIAVSDVFNHSVKLFDSDCVHQHTFGGFGYSDGLLDHPRGLVVDHEGRTLICDQFNHRVVRHWVTDETNDKTDSDCILSAQQLDNECPWAIGFSEKHNMLAVSYGTGDLSVYTGYGSRSLSTV